MFRCIGAAALLLAGVSCTANPVSTSDGTGALPLSIGPGWSLLLPRQSVQLVVSNAPAGATPAWSSTVPSVATVTSAGLVTAIAPGADTIIAVVNGDSAIAQVVVQAGPPASIVIAPAPLALIVGASQQLADTVLDAFGDVLESVQVTWASAMPSVVTVTSSGMVTAVATGTGEVTATVGTVSADVAVTVAPIPVATVKVSPDTDSLITGTSQQFGAVALDATGSELNGRVVTWTTTDPSIATVSDGGLVTAIAPGSTTITATIEGHSAGAAVFVSSPPVASILLNPGSLAITSGCVAALNASPRDAQGQVVPGVVLAWTTHNPAIATVSQAGLVQGIAPGTAEITVTAQGQSAMSEITVSQPQSTPGLPAC